VTPQRSLPAAEGDGVAATAAASQSIVFDRHRHFDPDFEEGGCFFS